MAGINTYEKELQRQQQLQQQQQQQQMIQQQKAQQQQQQQMIQKQKAQQQQQKAAAKQPAQQTTATQGNAQTQTHSLNNYERPATAAYTPSQAVLDAQTALQNLQTTKPQGYANKYGPQMDALLNQIQNPEKFKWDFNGDELFKSYADLYTQNGKQASMDAMGQAAALTGGYGNSYAQQVGNQAYDEYLRALYDKGLEFRDRAYEQFLNEQQNKFNQYGLLSQADESEYGRYNDLLNDWRDSRNFAADQYNQLSQQDYNRYMDARDFAEKQYQYDANMKENIRQFNESLDWDKMSTQQKYAADWAMQILANGQMPTADMLRDAGLSAADAQKLMAQIEAGGGTGGRSGVLVTEGAFNNYYETNPDGSLKKDKNGNLIPYDTSKGNYSVLSNPTSEVSSATTIAGTASKVGNTFNDLWKKLIKNN